jgi:hypothetical protein
MNDIVKLQNDLAERKQDLVTAKVLQDLKLTSGWRKIIEEGFISGLANQLVSELATATAERRQQNLAVLTGISALTQYLEEVTTKGLNAEVSIEDTQSAIAELLGAN